MSFIKRCEKDGSFDVCSLGGSLINYSGWSVRSTSRNQNESQNDINKTILMVAATNRAASERIRNYAGVRAVFKDSLISRRMALSDFHSCLIARLSGCRRSLV